MTISTGSSSYGSCLASCPVGQDGSRLRRSRPPGLRGLPVPHGVDGRSCIAARAATRSLSSRCSRREASRSPRRSATRFSRVQPTCRAQRDGCSKQSRSFPGRSICGLLEVLAGDLVERLEECLASGMVSAARAHVAFRHELARLTIEEAIAPDRRIALHRGALAALVARGGDDPDVAHLAHHAEAAGDPEAVLRWAPRAAGRAASSGAHREAAAQYARALSFSGALSLQMRSELLVRRADECYMTDQFAEAIEAQLGALDCQRQLRGRARGGRLAAVAVAIAALRRPNRGGRGGGARSGRAAGAAPAWPRACARIQRRLAPVHVGGGPRRDQGVGCPCDRARRADR